MPYFRREGHPVVTIQAFLDFVGDHLPQEPFLELPILTGRSFMNLLWPRNPLLLDCLVGLEMRLKLLHFLGLLVLLSFFDRLKLLANGRRGFLVRMLL